MNKTILKGFIHLIRDNIGEGKKKYPLLSNVLHFIYSFLIVFSITAIGFFLDLHIQWSIILLYLLAVVFSAMRWGFWPYIFTTIISILAFDYFFLSSLFSFTTDIVSIITIIVFLVVGISINLLIIRERKASLNAYEKAQHLSILQEVMNGAKKVHLVYLDRDFNFVRVNQTYAKTCGYAPEAMIGKNHFDLYPNKENEEIFKGVRDTGVPVEFQDKPFVFPDQPKRGITYWDWTLVPVKDYSGTVQGLVFSLVETTERKRVEERFSYLASFPEENSSPIAELDSKGKIIYANPAMKSLYPDVLEKGSTHPMFSNIWKEANQTNREVQIGSRWWLVTKTFKHKEATRFYFSDITKQKLADTEKNHLLQQLIDTNKELESFSYSVSHDLRAPLRSLSGFSQILLEDYSSSLDEQGANYLKRIQENVRKMNELIEAILRLSRQSRKEIHPETVDLTRVSRSIIERLQKEDPQRVVTIEIAQDLSAEGDVELLTDAMENLLQNAWKYTKNNSHAAIEVGSKQEKHQTIFFVKDNGVGFDMTYSDKLFKPFSRLHSDNDFPGVGIGLSTVQRIIQKHSGQIWAESTPGKGAGFYFTLPSCSSKKKIKNK